MDQGADPSVPVVVSSTASLCGEKGKEWAGFMKLTGVTLKNRSPRAVSFVRLGWVVVTQEDRAARRSDDEARLLGGLTEPFAPGPPGTGRRANLAARGRRKVDSPVIDFLREAQPLMRDGALYGRFVLKVRVAEVYFADGGVWQESAVSLKRQDVYTALDEWPLDCRTMCGSTRNDGIVDTCISDPIGGIVCFVDTQICFEGRCICTSTSCNDCPDEDGDGHRVCKGDCNDDPNNGGNREHRDAIEYCDDGEDTDCDGNGSWNEPGCLEPDPPPPTPENPDYPPPDFGGGGGNGPISPVVIDTRGDGFHLTDSAGGVAFDLNSDGTPERLIFGPAAVAGRQP
jgi:hypothetical protein